MFYLYPKGTQQPLLMRNGTPFEYSSRELARLAKSLLEPIHKVALVVA